MLTKVGPEIENSNCWNYLARLGPDLDWRSDLLVVIGCHLLYTNSTPIPGWEV